MKKLLFILTIFLTQFALAQDSVVRPHYLHIGTRVGLGQSRFSGIEQLEMRSDYALQIGLVARRQLTPWFALEMQPGFLGTRAQVHGFDADSGNQEYIDYYHLYNIDLPVLSVFRLGGGDWHFFGYAGPAVGFNVYATKARAYGDPVYNEQADFPKQVLKEMEMVTFSGVAGAGVEVDTRSGIFGIDARFYQPFTRAGEINEERFSVYVATIGLSWMY
jgi:hypothetical protein